MKRDLIEELKSSADLFAECPQSGELFRLSKAIMFYVDAPIPKEARALIAQKEEDIAQRKKKVSEDRRKLKKRAEIAAIATNIGKIIEKIAPALKDSGLEPRDCRPLFEPVDYLVFRGLTAANGNVDSIEFVDIKTGGAGLKEHQKQIKAVVESGGVKWDSYGGRL